MRAMTRGGLVMGLAMLLAACHVSVNAPAAPAAVPVTAAYAAMDEVPVQGGEDTAATISGVGPMSGSSSAKSR